VGGGGGDTMGKESTKAKPSKENQFDLQEE
jgi:hypothetical protein